jgi:hypothetical protein
VSRTASIGLALVRGGSHFERVSCERRSGDAFTKNQRYPSALIPTLHWVLSPRSPVRVASHWRHAQFHWGTPPPAADPNIWIIITCLGKQIRVFRDHPSVHKVRWRIVESRNECPVPALADHLPLNTNLLPQREALVQLKQTLAERLTNDRIVLVDQSIRRRFERNWNHLECGCLPSFIGIDRKVCE